MSKKVIEPVNVLTAGDMSGDLASSPSIVKYMDNIAYQCVFTGSPVGVFNVEVSLDNVKDASGKVLPATNWAPMSATGINVSGGSPQFIDVNQTSACQIRCTFTAGGGSSGSLDILVSSKEI